ncbi:bifunctional DNA primase/polymerase [Nonomuraea pusilla]|uniref:Bifunctional DNA primase/polymerase, N-terminal n=1 Tax=Nonomuraea pusilla TaxID=46177 RepID=A0A1H7G157_9ACTN|nr:bifunctional DNA primase/polymerase [Nonomuraea pusilla]SEK32083.1 Bifunctional DNA primase/polymerase, N-terminal [Nonomuraea pusilla]
MTPHPPRQTLPYALAAAARGWHVFPLTPGDKVPPKGWKWKEHNTTDPDTIRRFWTGTPYNIGIATGPSQLVAIDLDTPKNGEQPPPPWNQPGVNDGADVLALLCEQAGHPLPLETFQVRTRRGGTHLYFTAPEGLTLGNTSGTKGQGLGWLIDTRASGGYVVAPGSYVDLPDGTGTYDAIHTTEPAPLPSWLAERLTQSNYDRQPVHVSDVLAALGNQSAGYATTALRNELQQVLDARPGTRNHTLNAAAFALGQLVAAGLLPHRLTEDALHTAAQATGLSPREAAATIRSGLTAGARQPRQGIA